jgi:hypothetical protein
MPAAALIGLSAFALLSGPICGGIQWHYWNRARGPNFWTHRIARKREEEIHDENESIAV